jgi:hypothetical protein
MLDFWASGTIFRLAPADMALPLTDNCVCIFEPQQLAKEIFSHDGVPTLIHPLILSSFFLLRITSSLTP